MKSGSHLLTLPLRLALLLVIIFGPLQTLPKEFPCRTSSPPQASSEKPALSQTSTGWTIGNKRVVVLRLEFPDHLETVSTEQQCQEMMAYADRVLRTNSYGAFSLTSTISPAIRMPKPETEFTDLGQIEATAWQLAANVGILRDDFDLDVIVGINQLGSDSHGNIGRRGIMMNRAASNSIIVHELGHNLGLVHARSWVGYHDSISGAGESREYGDHFDIMGSGDRSFSSWAKCHLGWFPADGVCHVTNSQIIDITFYETDTLQSGATYAIRIPAADKTYWIDCQLPTTQSPQAKDGILVRWALPIESTASTYLLDMRPETVLSTTDAPLLLGRTFSDRKRNVHITPLKKLQNGFSVEVNIGDFHDNIPPDLAIAAPDVIQLEIGAPFEFSATATDPDGDPISIVWDFGDGSYGLGPSVTNMFVATGEYSVICEASDHKGGVTMKSLIARVGSPTSYRLSGAVTRNGLPLPNARIYISGQETTSARTGPNGRYVLLGLQPGSYTLKGAFEGLNLRLLNFELPYTVPNAQENLNWDCPRISVDNLSFDILEDSGQTAIRLSGQSDTGPLIFKFQALPLHGVLGGLPPNVYYTPDPNFAGDDSFTYYARNGETQSLPVTVSITVQPQNDLPLVFGRARGRAETVWTKRLSPSDLIADLSANANGCIYVLTATASTNGTDLSIRCLDAQGNEQWNRVLDLARVDIAEAIFPRTDGVVVTGITFNNGPEGASMSRITSRNEVLWINRTKASSYRIAELSGEDAFLIAGVLSGASFVAKIDGATGRELWRKPVPTGFKPNHLDVGEDGQFAMTGSVGLLDTGTGWDCATLKFSANGDLLWNQSFDRQSDEQGVQVHVAGDGSVYVASESSTRIWITHYSKTGVYLWQTDPLLRPPHEAQIIFDRNDIPHMLTVEPIPPTLPSILLRFKTNTPERIWASTNANSQGPVALRVASDGTFEAITTDATEATGWLTTIAPTGAELSHVRLRHSGGSWRGIVRPAQSGRGFFLADYDGSPRIAKIVNEALPQTLILLRDQNLIEWPAPIALDDKPMLVEPTRSPEHGVLSGVWPNWIYSPFTGFTGEDRIGFKAWHPGEIAIEGEFRINVVPPLDLRVQQPPALTLTADPSTAIWWSRDLKEWTPLRGQTPTTLNRESDQTSKFFRIGR